jgi:O-antigen/teichoic acid export membrane protein
VRLLGVESYALVGFYSMLYAVFVRLELGLGTTFNREVAQRSNGGTEPQELRDMLRTLEVVYWSMAVAIGCVVASLSPAISRHWLQAQHLRPSEVQHAVLMMGVVMAAQWPISLYEGGLRGRHRQVALNAVGATMATIRGVGALTVLTFVAPSITAFFIWQAVVNVAHSLVLAVLMRQSLAPAAAQARFRRASLRQVWRFAAGVSAVSLLSLVLMQLDKILLSKLLPLREFGYYTIATAVVGALAIISGPLFETIFPRLSDLVARGDERAIRRLYHAGCQFTAALVFPAGAALVCFALPIVTLWLHDTVTATQTYMLVKLLAVGTTANVLMMLPLALQFAYGWTTLSIYKNVVAIIVLVPALIGLVLAFGVIGAAFSWILLNVGYLCIEIPIMHTRLLRGSARTFYWSDLGRPLAITIVVFAVSMAPRGMLDTSEQVALAATTTIVSIIMTMAVSEPIRETVTAMLSQAIASRAMRKIRGA